MKAARAFVIQNWFCLHNIKQQIIFTHHIAQLMFQFSITYIYISFCACNALLVFQNHKLVSRCHSMQMTKGKGVQYVTTRTTSDEIIICYTTLGTRINYIMCISNCFIHTDMTKSTTIWLLSIHVHYLCNKKSCSVYECFQPFLL